MKKKLATILILSLTTLSSPAHADQIVQQFKSPSFNGFGWSQHVQAIDAQERAREQQLRDAEAARDALARAEAANTPLARFMALFTSQVYAQLATQLSNNLFGDDTASSDAGVFNLDGNTITYIKTGTEVRLTVVDAAGNQTVIVVPIASFAF
jgi:opacity protein-like surface antigen